MDKKEDSSVEDVLTDTDLEDSVRTFYVEEEPNDEIPNEISCEETLRRYCDSDAKLGDNEESPILNDEDNVLKDGEENESEEAEGEEVSQRRSGFEEKIDEYSPYGRACLKPQNSLEDTKDVETKPPPQKTKIRKSKGEWKNPMRSEMHYYLSTLRLAVPKMTNELDKLLLRRWIFFILRNVPDKLIRNRYLLLVTISALNNECMDAVKEEPPPALQTSLPSLPKCFYRTKPARWESDIYWDRLVTDMPKSTMICPLHKTCRQNAGLEKGIIEAVGGQLMDQEYKYLLYLIRPFIVNLTRAEDRVRASVWLHKLASIRPCSCAFMKGLRNDYMQAFLGYASLGRCPGPFKRFPPDEALLPLSMESKKYCDQPLLSELSDETAQDFLSSIKPIEKGAVCYVALAGHPDNTKISFSPLDVDYNVEL